MPLRYQNSGCRSRFASESSLVFSFKRPSDHYKWVSESEFLFKRVDQAPAKLRFLKEFFQCHCGIKIRGAEADSPYKHADCDQSNGRASTLTCVLDHNFHIDRLYRFWC